MTVMHEQRYTTSSTRNVDRFLRYREAGPQGNLSIAHFAGMEMRDLKHHIGLRNNDSKYDGELSHWLGKVKDHATKAGIAAKARKKADPTIVTELQAGQTIDNLVAASEVKPTAKVVYSADDVTVHHAPAEKKVNPKKAARQAALEASGTAPKKINADTARAEKMAGMAKRQPRLITKH